ncbi:MAG TPA: hypothetical protein VIY86_12015 [Pirellulaceae bacterium]
MKKTISLLALAFALQATPASAWVGGPWSNDQFSPTNSGTYQAALYIRNGVGMARFSDSPTYQFSRFNQSVIYYKGIVYTGTAFGYVDYVQETIIGITNGDTNNTVITENANGLAPGIPFNPLTGSVTSGAGANVQTCNTSWTCHITSEAPVTRFKGDGEATFFGDLTTIDRITSTTTVIEEGDTETVIEEDITDFGGQDSKFPEIGARAKLWVYGTQISQQATAPL